jgi:ABC-2 type transport system ATP-binding protein
MDAAFNTAALRKELASNLSQGVTHLAELTSRHANNRQLVYRAVLLKRELSRAETRGLPDHVDQGLALLDDFIADQASADVAVRSRHDIAEEARQRAMAMEISRPVAVECEGLSKGFGRGEFALKDVSLSVRCGEIVSIVGLNGNGKTTLFRLLVGELRPERGALRFPAVDSGKGRINWSRVRNHTAYVPQELPAWHGSLKSNLHYEAAVHGVRGASNEREVDYIVERMGLTNELHKRWQELSGGYKLRFALARALVWKPTLLILDEPLANLDFLTLQIVLKDLRHLTDSLRYPLGSLVSSQHVHEIEEVSDKLLLLTKGTVTFFGAVDEIGSERQANTFEIAGHNVDLGDLQEVLKGPNYYSIYYSGVAFVVTTSTTVTAEQLVGLLLARNMPLTYFRDISRSAKGLLQNATR